MHSSNTLVELSATPFVRQVSVVYSRGLFIEGISETMLFDLPEGLSVSSIRSKFSIFIKISIRIFIPKNDKAYREMLHPQKDLYAPDSLSDPKYPIVQRIRGEVVSPQDFPVL